MKIPLIIIFQSIRIIGTRTAPREIMLDNSILPSDTNQVRVSTPPRVITLSDHHFPSATDEQYTPEEENGQHEFDQRSVGSIEDKRLTVAKPKKLYQHDLFNTRYAIPFTFTVVIPNQRLISNFS